MDHHVSSADAHPAADNAPPGHDTPPGQAGPFADIAAFSRLPRLAGLALSQDGTRLVATMQQPDGAGARYASSIWQLPLTDDTEREPVRLTWSRQGETSPAFLPGGELLFVSRRPDPRTGEDDDAAIWVLPPTGEPHLVAARAGGLGIAAVARDTGMLIARGSDLAWTEAAGLDAARTTGRTSTDARRRTVRKDRKVTAILHTGMPIRYWDHELGDESPRLLRFDTTGSETESLTGDGDAAHEASCHDLSSQAGQALHESSATVSADGTILVTSWRVRRGGGRVDNVLVRIDVESGERTVLADEDGVSFDAPVLSPDGAKVAARRRADGGFETPLDERLQLRAVDGTHVIDLDLGDLWPKEWTFAADGTVLFVAGDLHGRGAVLAVDTAASTATARPLATDASYSSLCPAPDGRHIYALRSAIDEVPTPVRLNTWQEHQRPDRLPTPAPTPPLPGELTELEVPTADGARVHAWLCLPAAGERPAPLMQWIHGGPFSSYNSWSWRWSPWVAVARGYAVLMPDPALSTGYGSDWIARAWPHRAGLVWRDVQTVLDEVLTRPEIDAGHTACLGASFGGYMTNWVAGHTDRFEAIVTHAGLWALDQQHTTTDGAQWKTGLFATPAEHPDWYAENSPHNFADAITTPMLVVHGNRDYRVPVSEALRLWWDLCRRHEGAPEELKHRFLQLTGENHWVLSPANVQIWYETVLGFCDQHVRGRPFVPSELL